MSAAAKPYRTGVAGEWRSRVFIRSAWTGCMQASLSWARCRCGNRLVELPTRFPRPGSLDSRTIVTRRIKTLAWRSMIFTRRGDVLACCDAPAIGKIQAPSQDRQPPAVGAPRAALGYAAPDADQR